MALQLLRFLRHGALFAGLLLACSDDSQSTALDVASETATDAGDGRRDRAIDLQAQDGQIDDTGDDRDAGIDLGGDDGVLGDAGDTSADARPDDAGTDGPPTDDAEDVRIDDLPPCDDEDGDGYGPDCILGTDCDDDDPFTHPGAPQICDGNDNTCGGTVPADEADGDNDDFVVCSGFADWQGDDADIDGGDDCDDADDGIVPGTGACPTEAFYLESFERDDGGWSAGGVNPSWQHGTPDGVVIIDAGEGQNAWKTNLDGPYSINEQSWLMSPPLDLSGMSDDPVLRFLHARSLEANDGVVVEVSRNGGPWGAVGVVGEGRNWYNDTTPGWWSGVSGGWVLSEHLLTGTAGTELLRFRFRLDSSASGVLEGFAVDQVALYGDITDLAVTAIEVNPGGCGVTDSTRVRAFFSNVGTERLEDVDATLWLDDVLIATEALTDMPAGTNLTYDFEATLDLTSRGVVRVEVDVPEDDFADNDAAELDTEEFPGFLGLPYFEDFELGGGGWEDSGTLSSWSRGTPTISPNAATSGAFVWATNPTGNYNNNEESFLESTCMDFSVLADDPWLQFSLFYATENGYDDLWLEMSTDGGTAWNRVLSSTGSLNWYNDSDEDTWTDDSGDWLNARTQLADTAGEGDVRLRFAFRSDGSVTYSGIAIDDLRITVDPPQDIAVLAVDVTRSGCQPTAAEQVTVQLRNQGAVTAASVPLELRVDGAVVATEARANVNPGVTLNHTFAQTVDLSEAGDHLITVTALLPADEQDANDSMSTTMENLGTSAAFLPYAESFESGAAGWTTYGTANSWELGAPADARLSSAADGTQAWKTDLDADYNNNELSYVQSPCFDFSAQVLDPRFTLSLNYAMEKGSGASGTQYDEAWLEISTDDGESWSAVADTDESAENWYTDPDGWGGISDGWLVSSVTLSGIAGEPRVRIRVAFSSDFTNTEGGVYEGIAFDAVALEPDTSEDMAVMSVIVDETGCGLGFEDVTAKLTNLGAGPGSHPMVTLVVDDVELITEEVFADISPGTSLLYTFSVQADLTAVGLHRIEAAVAIPFDRHPDNDILPLTLVNRGNIDTFPYTQSFETSDANWTEYGTRSSWQRGVPTDDVIDSAPDGTRVWTTDLDGDYRDLELSYLEPPCMDFSSLVSTPVISFDQNFLTEPCCDRGFIEISTDSGQSWSRLPANLFIANGYNDVPNQWWEGSSGGWRRVEAALTGLQGVSDVRLRFVMVSDNSIGDDGFAIDRFEITTP